MITEQLIQAGLSEKEAAVYEKMLESGPTSVGTLLKSMPYKRGDLYNILYSLRDKELLSEELKKGIMTFTLESPEKLKDLVAAEKEKLEQRQKLLSDVFPQIKSLHNLSMNKPGVRFYEGRDGIINVYEQLLVNGQNIDSFEDKGEMAKFIPDYSHTYPFRRVKKNIFNRVIAAADNPINESNPALMRETRFIPTQKFLFRMDIKIAGRLTSLISFQKESPVAILIDNQEIADNFRILFQILWDMLAAMPPLKIQEQPSTHPPAAS